MNNEWDVIYFFHNSPLAIQPTYPGKFPLVEVAVELIFWYVLKLHQYLSFNVFNILKSLAWDHFLFV